MVVSKGNYATLPVIFAARLSLYRVDQVRRSRKSGTDASIIISPKAQLCSPIDQDLLVRSVYYLLVQQDWYS